MLQELQNLVGELNNKRPANNNMGGNGPRSSKLNLNSRIGGQDSDFSNFSIKDAINRPNQFVFY